MPLNIISQPELLTAAVCAAPEPRPRSRPAPPPPSRPAGSARCTGRCRWATLRAEAAARARRLGKLRDERGLAAARRRARATLIWRARCSRRAPTLGSQRTEDAMDLADDDEAELLRLLRDAVGPRRFRSPAARRRRPLRRQLRRRRPSARSRRGGPVAGDSGGPPPRRRPRRGPVCDAHLRHGPVRHTHLRHGHVRPRVGNAARVAVANLFEAQSSPRRPMPRRRLERATCAWRASVRSRKAIFSR